jgi:hypothetical protein
MEITRFKSLPEATLGVVYLAPGLVLSTLELPWKENRFQVSCIPSGAYTARRKISPTHGETFEICDVPGRSDILIHVGNVASETKGCVLVARGWQRLNGQPALFDSKIGFDLFMRFYRDVNDFTLTIRGGL